MMGFWKGWAAQRKRDAEKKKLFELLMAAMVAYINNDTECLKSFMNDAVIQYVEWTNS